MALPFVFATQPTGNVPAVDLDTNFNAVAALGVIPCTATGTNTITLVPFANTPTISAYTNLAPSFVFIAAATSTGAVQIGINSIAPVAASKWNGLQPLGNNDIFANLAYRATFVQSLNGGAGGFLVDSFGYSNSTYALEIVIDGGGSTITTGIKGFIRVPVFSFISSWQVMADQSGSIVVDVLGANSAVPSASIVGSGNKPTLSSAQYSGVVTPSGWTQTGFFVTNEWIGFNVISATTVTRVTVDLDISKL